MSDEPLVNDIAFFGAIVFVCFNALATGQGEAGSCFVFFSEQTMTTIVFAHIHVGFLCTCWLAYSDANSGCGKKEEVLGSIF